MSRPIFSASTLPVQPSPSRLLLFIQQAQLTLLYGEGSAYLPATLELKM